MTPFERAVVEFKDAVARTPAMRRFDDADLEFVYAIAHRLFDRGHFDRAARHFGFLTLYRPADSRFLKGLGASQFMARDIEHAAATWALLVLLEPADADAAYLFGRAMLMLGEGRYAEAAFLRAIELGGAESPLAVRARAMLDLIAA
jgi:Flp pilus assembly protein TadD